MAGISVNYNADLARRYLGDLGDEFRVGSSRMRISVARAINRTTAHMLTHISRQIRATYYVKKADLDKSAKITKAKAVKHSAGRLAFAELGSLPLSSFGARAAKTYVSVKVLKANRARRIQPGGDRKIIATRKGRAAVWMAKGHVMARVEDQDTPLVLYGPSFMSFFTRQGMPEALRGETHDFFVKRLEQEAKFMISGRGLVNFGRGR